MSTRPQQLPSLDGSPPTMRWAKPGPYVTQLSPVEEYTFQQWVSKNKIPWRDQPNADYDMRGFWKAMSAGDARASRATSNQHFPDVWKTPYHKSFSNESIYAKPNAPRWVGNNLVDDKGHVIYQEGDK